MKVLYSIFSAILLTIALNAQNFQTRDKIDLNVGFNLAMSNQFYNYNYSLSNGIGAQESVYVFDLRIPNNILITSLNASKTWEKVFFPQAPEVVRWVARVDHKSHHFKDLLEPGTTRSGFSFSSNSLPGIVIYYSEGWAPAPVFEEGEATDKIPGYSDRTPYGPGVVGKTVGPVLSPSPFVLLALTDTLNSYTTQCRSLGWIKDQAIANKYLGYFNAAKKSLKQNNPNTAHATLTEILNEVNIDSTSNLTGEAYALIRYNTEYLLKQLPTAPTVR